MEIATLLSRLSLYDKVYDSKKNNDKNETIDLLFLASLPKNAEGINVEHLLPIYALMKMYHHVDFVKKNNRLHYFNTMYKIRELQCHKKDFKIYIDNYGDFRKIIVNVDGKAILVKNMYFVS